LGVWIGGFACLFGFAVIWHLWWLAVLAFLGLVGTLVRRTFEEDVEYEVSAAEAKRHDVAALKGSA
jgi:cytochrome o ubiquinol oxidase subunit 1